LASTAISSRFGPLRVEADADSDPVIASSSSGAGAIISGSKGTAQAKAEALEAKGVRVGRTPTQVADIAAEIAGAKV